jgi:amino acid adenylation domain-containing protein/FkbM family methyltransferase
MRCTKPFATQAGERGCDKYFASSSSFRPVAFSDSMIGLLPRVHRTPGLNAFAMIESTNMTRIPRNDRAEDRVIARDPDESIASSPTATDAERQQLLVDWNNTAVAYPRKNFCLHQLIEEQAARTPNQEALVFEQHTLTYGELNRRANKLAHYLKGLGAGPDVIVGLFVERSLEVLVGILGILKAGAAYVPIDAGYPQERVAFILTDAHVSLLLTQTSLLENLPVGAVQAVFLDTFDWTDSEGSTQNDARLDPGNLAYVIYTSGSTGRPKGVCIEHRNIVNYVLGVAERLQLKPGMNHATVSTFAADLGNTVIFPALATGGRLHIISQERVENQALLSDYFSREKIDVLKIVPSHLAALQTGKNPEQVMPRKRLILGGEASRLDWIEQLRAFSPNCEIYNHYGPTETTVGVLTYHVDPQLPVTQSGTLPLGRPLPNSRIYILDEGGQPVPIGVQGELCIGGAGVARGYLNRPDLTAEKFVADHFSPDPNGRMYRTGDRARYLPDGNIEFGGRIDHQVKIHGYRIELGEIEGALREQHGVRDALVLACEDESGSKELVAYVVPKRANQALWGNKELYLLPDGSPVAHLNKSETDHLYNEIFVQQKYLRHGVTIHDGDCVVDASANIGLFTVFVSRLARNLRIISLEANPTAFACLKANAEAWGTAVKCLPIGLSREHRSSEREFFEGLSFGSGPDGRLHTKAESAQQQTLSSIIAEEGMDHVDLLKIKLANGEVDVLPDLSADDWARIRQMVIEVDQQENLPPITTLLEQQGYELLVEKDPLGNTELSYVYAIRPSAEGSRLLRQEPAKVQARSLPSADEEILTPVTLRKYLKERLPQYMVPSGFVLMEKFPLTSNGKIDRKALPAYSHENIRSAHDFVRPQTKTEKDLAAIWTGLLKVESISIHDDFFELGGHSLMAIKLVSQIRDVFGVDLPLATLLQASTIAGLAGILRKEEWTPSWSSLVPIRPGGSKPPLYLMHAHGGNVLEYHALANLLEPDQPVYAFQSRGLNGHIVKDLSLEEMASAYIEELRSFQPKGPYYLGGFCLGGLLALEAAQQLMAAGQEVALVVVIQSMHPDARRFKPTATLFHRWWYRTTKRINLEMENLSYRGMGYVAQRLRYAWDVVRAKAAIAFDNRTGKAPIDPSRLPAQYIFRAIGNENKKAMNKYVPRPYDGDVVLFRASKQLRGIIADEYLNWKQVLHGNLDVCEVPGHQQNLMLEPNVLRLAKELTDRLKVAQQRFAAKM